MTGNHIRFNITLMKANDIVKFKEAIEEGDESATMTVIEMRGERALVRNNELVDLAIAPTFVYSVSDLVLA